MPFEVVGYLPATKQKGTERTVIYSSESREDAERFVETQIKQGGGWDNAGYKTGGIEERQVASPTYTEVSRPLTDYEEQKRRQSDREQLADQAIEKVNRGEQISSAEAQAAGVNKNDLINYNKGALSYKESSQISNSQKEQLDNLNKAVREGNLSESQARSVAEQILNPNAFKPNPDKRKETNIVINTPKPIAEDIIKTYRNLPSEYQTGQNLGILAKSTIIEPVKRTGPASKALEYREEVLKRESNLIGVNGTKANKEGDINILGFPSTYSEGSFINGKSSRDSGLYGGKRTGDVDSANNNILGLQQNPTAEIRKAKFSEISLDTRSQLAKQEGKLGTAAFFGVLAASKGIAEGAISIFNPKTYIQSVKDVKNLIFHGEGQPQIGESLRNQPFQTLGQFAGMELGGKSIGYGVNKFQEVKTNIKIDKLFESTGKDIIPFEEIQSNVPALTPGKSLSTQILLKELKGVERVGVRLDEGFGTVGKLVQEPIFGKPELIDPSLIKKPDLLLAKLEQRSSKKSDTVFGKETNIPQVKNNFAESVVKQNSDFVFTPEEAINLFSKRKEGIAFKGGENFGTLRNVQGIQQRITLTPVDLKFGDLSVVKNRKYNPTTRRPSDLKFLTGETRKQIGVQYKLPGYREVIIPTDLQGGFLRVRKFTSGKIEQKRLTPQQSLADLRTEYKFSNKQKLPEILKPVKEVQTSSGQVLLLEEPIVKVKTEVKSKVLSKRKLKDERITSASNEFNFITEEVISNPSRERVGVFVAERGISKVKIKPEPPIIIIKPISDFRTQVKSESKLSPLIKSSTVFPKVDSLFRSNQAKVSQRIDNKIKLSTQVTPRTSPKIKTDTKIGVSTGIRTTTLTGTAVSTSILVTPEVATKIDLLNPPRTTTRLSPPTPRQPPRPPKQRDEESKSNKESLKITQAKSYILQVRRGDKRGDKFVTVEKRLPINKAIQKGTEITDNYIEASFRLVPSNSNPKTVDNPFTPDLSKYRYPTANSKLPRNTFIEKNSFRLDNKNELDDISYFKRKKELESLKEKRNKIIFDSSFSSIPYKTELNLKLPKTSGVQKKILELAKKQNAIVTGSFAQKTLLKKSRNFTDLDIVAKNPRVFTNALKKELKNQIEIKKQRIRNRLGTFTINRVYSKGKLIADIDPLKYAEEGTVRRFGTIEVEGLKLINLQSRLAAKKIQIERGKKQNKIFKDIKQLQSSNFKSTNFFKNSKGVSI